MPSRRGRFEAEITYSGIESAASWGFGCAAGRLPAPAAAASVALRFIRRQAAASGDEQKAQQMQVNAFPGRRLEPQPATCEGVSSQQINTPPMRQDIR